MIRLVIREELFIKGLPDDLVQIFCQDNTFANPKKIQSLRMFKRYLDDKNAEHLEPSQRREFYTKQRRIRWMLKNQPEDVTLWRRADDWLALPRGYLPEVKTTMESRGLEFGCEDLTVCPPLTIEPLRPTGELFDYQEKALLELAQSSTGTCEAPTGAGKTQMLLTLAAQLRTPTLIITHTSELLKQTAQRCKDWLGLDPGILGGGKNKVKDITIAMLQTLNRMKITKDDPIYSRFGCVILDEAHHSPASTFSDVLRRLPCRYKYGFTATAWRKDKMEFIIWRMIGPITAKVHHQEVADAGRIVWPDIVKVYTNYWYDISEDPSKWGEMVSDLITNEERNWLIVRNIQHWLADPKARGLVLTDRIEHANILAAMTKPMEPALLTGDLTKTQRDESMARVRSGAKLTIATIHLLGEGVDCPGWDSLFLVSPISGGPRTLQAVGRIARPAPGKERAILLDFIDRKIPMLLTASYARQKLYRSKGERQDKKGLF